MSLNHVIYFISILEQLCCYNTFLQNIIVFNKLLEEIISDKDKLFIKKTSEHHLSNS